MVEESAAALGGLGVFFTVDPLSTGILEHEFVTNNVLAGDVAGLREALLRLLADNAWPPELPRLDICLGMAELNDVVLFGPLYLEDSNSAESACRPEPRRAVACCLEAGRAGPLSPATSIFEVLLLVAPSAWFSSSPLWSSSLSSESDVEVKSAGAKPRLPLFDSDFARLASLVALASTVSGCSSSALAGTLTKLLDSSRDGILLNGGCAVSSLDLTE